MKIGVGEQLKELNTQIVEFWNGETEALIALSTEPNLTLLGPYGQRIPQTVLKRHPVCFCLCG